METVLVVGATGNIGVSAAIAALGSNSNVLAIVRNQDSADKLFKHAGTSNGITVVEADVTSDTGVKVVVDQVRAGKLPAFQHVYACVGEEYVDVPRQEITTERLRRNMNMSFEANFSVYRNSIGYLLEQKDVDCTWTCCTGLQGELGLFALPAMTQGALFSMATAAARENEKTNVRFNEIEVDRDAKLHGVTKASDFANVYEMVLGGRNVRSSRVRVENDKEDLKKLRYQKKF
ncbi:hypothetical protein LTR56_027474 [Elasticomyces elasticus]|nr:hypothetical protein LTR56_027474 [Elasticomyces elasticus]KAK3616781.1 hypothetical protein LTR22_026955 [Elasticomyces elasticus]KAK4897062.1 hypothetical protein LTR49_028047 [Elasticomyces elasticus]KAK5736380.1 hypothetical protein LTS12_026195 [Elasticomyces elasticus]